MSLRIGEVKEAYERYEILRQKVIDLLGIDVLYCNHYGMCLLYNEEIDLKTTDKKIIKIADKFKKLYFKIKELFDSNGVEWKEEYFTNEGTYGSLCFLKTVIDINNGVEYLKPTIDEFIKLYKKINRLAKKYNNLGEVVFEKFVCRKKPYYLLYNNKIYPKTKVSDIDTILSNFDNLNGRVNDLLQICNYKNKNLLISVGDNTYSLFSAKINLDAVDNQIIDIINKAQLFESRIKCVLKELHIIENYRIVYEMDHICVWFGGVGQRFYLNVDYDKIKEEFIDMDKCYHFKKSKDI